MADKKIGEITHYYTNIGVGIIKNHENIEEIKKGKEVGIKVKDKVRDGDEVYLVE